MKTILEKNQEIINFSSTDLNDPNNKSNFMLNLDRTVNFKENKTFQDLILNNKIDFKDTNLHLTTLKLESQNILDSEIDNNEETYLSEKKINDEDIKYFNNFFI